VDGAPPTVGSHERDEQPTGSAGVLEVEIEGMRLRDWPFGDLRRRHAVDLVDYMLRHQGRAHTGVQNILRSLSAMSEDAITDEIAEVNFVRGVRVRANDPRDRGETRPARRPSRRRASELVRDRLPAAKGGQSKVSNPARSSSVTSS
jgi:hypothetical protein